MIHEFGATAPAVGRRMRSFVVDTNVAVVANGRGTHAGAKCQLRCVRRLRELVQHGVVVLDQLGLILEEYGRHLRPAGQPGVGDAFLRHLFDHSYDATKCELVALTFIPDENRSFEEFPNDEALEGLIATTESSSPAARASIRDPAIFERDRQRLGSVRAAFCAARRGHRAALSL